MSKQGYGKDITLVAGALLPAFTGVVVNASGQAAVPAAGALVVGVVQNGGTAGVVSGAAATIRYDGETKMIAGGTIAAGAQVTVNATGQAVAATTGNYVLGIALASAVANDVFAVLLLAGGKV